MSLVKKSEEEKRQSARLAAEVFLDWYNKHCSTAYTELKDPRQRFPTIIRGKNWDFVAESINQDSWIAIEVKLITVRKFRQENSWWNEVFEQVTRKTQHCLKGTYWIIGAPKLYGIMDQRHRKELEDAICRILLEVEAMRTGEQLDIWPRIRSQLQHWSLRNLFGETKELTLIKKSIEGNSVKMVGRASFLSNVNELEKQAVKKLFSTNSKKANTQLGVAKQKGATETIWVIDGISDFLEDVRREVEAIDKELISNIDIIVFVDKSFKAVRIVWRKQ